MSILSARPLVALWAVCLTPFASLGAPSLAPPVVVGSVRDSTGTPLPNAQVVVNTLNRTTHTDANGAFVFRDLPAGRHHLTTLFLGFAPGHADVVVPAQGDTVRVTIVVHATTLTLSAVQVTATPVGTDPRDVTQSSTELAGIALAKVAASSIAQTLQREPGVAVRFAGPAASAPVIRGLQGERVLVLQDGERAGDLSSSASDHGMSVDPLVAQRIEVVRGPASLLYGNSALGGVVNVISNDLPTTIPSHIDGYAAAQLESAAPGAATSAGFTFPLTDHLGLVARGGARRGTDLRQGGGVRLDNTYNRNAYGSGGVIVTGSRGNGGLVARRYAFDYGLPSQENEGAHIEGQRSELVGRAEFTPINAIFQSVRVSGTTQWYNHDEVAANGGVNTSFNLRTQTADILARSQYKSVNGALGVSGLLKQYESAGDEALTPPANSIGLGAFFFEDIPLGNLSDPDARLPRLQFGARLDRYSITSKTVANPRFGTGVERRFTAGSGSLGLSIPLNPNISLAISTARAFRAPSVEELFSNALHEASGTFDRGNASLRKEVNQGFDGILRIHTARVNAQISAFGSAIANYITPNIVKDTTVVTDEGARTIPLNEFSQDDARLRGLEGQLEVVLWKNVVVGTSGDMVRGNLTTNDEPLPYLPPARLGGRTRWDNGRWSFGTEVLHGFAQKRVPPAIGPSDPSGLPTDSYTLVSLSAGLNLPLGDRVHVFALRLDNAGDAEFRDATSRIKTFALNPGRNLSLTYRLLF